MELNELSEDVIISILGQLDIGSIQNMCKIKHIRKICLENKNTISKNILKRYGYKIPETFKGSYVTLLKHLYYIDKNLESNSKNLYFAKREGFQDVYDLLEFNGVIYTGDFEQCSNCYEYYLINELYECDCGQYSCENCWDPELNMCTSCSKEANR